MIWGVICVLNSKIVWFSAVGLSCSFIYFWYLIQFAMYWLTFHCARWTDLFQSAFLFALFSLHFLHLDGKRFKWYWNFVFVCHCDCMPLLSSDRLLYIFCILCEATLSSVDHWESSSPIYQLITCKTILNSAPPQHTIHTILCCWTWYSWTRISLSLAALNLSQSWMVWSGNGGQLSENLEFLQDNLTISSCCFKMCRFVQICFLSWNQRIGIVLSFEVLTAKWEMVKAIMIMFDCRDGHDRRWRRRWWLQRRWWRHMWWW